MSKKFINNPGDCVDEALEGLVMTHLGLRILGDQRVVVHESVRRPFLEFRFLATHPIEYPIVRPHFRYSLKQIIAL